MKSISIKNLKSIRNSGEIDIKPLTVLIGKNSSGKSTFLRVFPLFKQSLTKNVSSPILWYGDYVDFGSFKNSINAKCISNESEPISFNFTFDTRLQINEIHGRSSIEQITFGFSLIKDVVKEYSFSFGSDGEISLKNINNNKFDLYINNQKLPLEELGFKERNGLYFETNVAEKAYENLRKKAGENTDLFEIRIALRRALDITKSFQLIFNEDKRKTSLLKVMERYSSRFSNSDFLEKARLLIEPISLYYCSLLIDIVFDSCWRTILDEFRKVQYFQPIRSRGDRYYRVQGLSVQNVDSDGLNAPMVLYSLGDKLNDFKEWCFENLGFMYDIENFSENSESTSVYVVDSDDERHNLTDVGFGYSQIFPIVLSLWQNTFNSRTFTEQMIVIEQPELHLHPAFQRKIIGLIGRIVLISKNKIKFIIETHSETIINSIASLINKNMLKPSDVNLLSINKINNESRFKKIRFKNDGMPYANDWPVGFFGNED